jgi:hypothetical protein
MKSLLSVRRRETFVGIAVVTVVFVVVVYNGAFVQVHDGAKYFDSAKKFEENKYSEFEKLSKVSEEKPECLVNKKPGTNINKSSSWRE